MQEGRAGGEDRDQGGNQNFPCDNSGSGGQAREATPASTRDGRGTQGVPGAKPRPPLSMKGRTVVAKTLGWAPALLSLKGGGPGPGGLPPTLPATTQSSRPLFQAGPHCLGLTHPTPLQAQEVADSGTSLRAGRHREPKAQVTDLMWPRSPGREALYPQPRLPLLPTSSASNHLLSLGDVYTVPRRPPSHPLVPSSWTAAHHHRSPWPPLLRPIPASSPCPSTLLAQSGPEA